MKTGAASPAERSAAGVAAGLAFMGFMEGAGDEGLAFTAFIEDAGDEGLAFTAFLLCLMAVVDFMAFMDLMDGTRERNWKGKNLQNVCSGKP